MHQCIKSGYKRKDDLPLLDVTYPVFTRLPGESYRRRLRPLLLCLCDIFWVLINSCACWLLVASGSAVQKMFSSQNLITTLTPRPTGRTLRKSRSRSFFFFLSFLNIFFNEYVKWDTGAKLWFQASFFLAIFCLLWGCWGFWGVNSVCDNNTLDSSQWEIRIVVQPHTLQNKKKMNCK